MVGVIDAQAWPLAGCRSRSRVLRPGRARARRAGARACQCCSAQLCRDRTRARDAGEQRACDDDDCGDVQAIAFGVPCRFRRRSQASGREYRHALLLGKRPAEILGETQRAAEHAHVGGQRGEQGAQPAQPRRATGITQRDDQQRVGNPVGKFIVDLADRRGLAAFHRHHAVEQVADQAHLYTNRAEQQTCQGRPPGQQRRTNRSADNAGQRNLVRRDIRARQPRGSQTRPAAAACGDRASVRCCIAHPGSLH